MVVKFQRCVEETEGIRQKYLGARGESELHKNTWGREIKDA
jgi:hypothetical protein